MSGATAEGDDRSNDPTGDVKDIIETKQSSKYKPSTSAGDAQGHDNREAELAEEDKKEDLERETEQAETILANPTMKLKLESDLNAL